MMTCPKNSSPRRFMNRSGLICILVALSCSPAMGQTETGPIGDWPARAGNYLALSRPDGGIYHQLGRIASGHPPNPDVVDDTCTFVDERNDCADFRLHGLLRMVYQFEDSPRLSPALRKRIDDTILTFKYWPDEPGVDSMCTWSENHYILFASAGYLAGQRFPGARFANSGESGREKMRINRPRILKWLELRYKTGFSEWLSNVYYDEDLTALLNLIDFAEDEEIVARATMVTDMLLADIALNSFHGIFGSTHGRSYEGNKKRGSAEATTSTSNLLFGLGTYRPGNMSAICMALTQRYRAPRVLRAIARDTERPAMVNKQRMGIRIAEAGRWGLGFDNFEDGMHWLTLEAYADYRVIGLTMEMFDAFNWWENDFFEPFAEQRGMIDRARALNALPAVAWYYRRDLTRNTREEVNIYTYRTPDYMLSTAQDYRKGYGGDQQSIWQATLGDGAVCFTTHPVKENADTPDYWTGSGTLPRAAQIENVAIVIYDIRSEPARYVDDALPYTHAWLPQEDFDEIIEREGWIFARHGDGYLALYSQNPYRWVSARENGAPDEVIVDGGRNIWICELGRKADNGSFESFVTEISSAALRVCGKRVFYESPSQGRLRFAWHTSLMRDGERIPLHDYPRYENPYASVSFPADVAEFRCGGDYLRLDWTELSRGTNALLN